MVRESLRTFGVYIRFQFRNEWRTTLFWMIGLSIYAGLIVSIYPSVKGAVNLEAIPEGLRTAFNLNDFTQLASFLSSQLLGVILPLLLPFYGMIMLSNVVAGAEERGRLDILLGNPIPRWQPIAGSFLVVAVYLFGIVTVLGAVIWTMARFLDLALTIEQAMRATFALWPTSLAFGALALFVSTRVRQRSLALGLPAAIVFLMYLFNLIGRLADSVRWVRWISAYNYYGTAITEGLWWPGMITLLVSAALLLALSIISFNRRDIYA
jgi:ABC-2 type transport system permease protein